MFLNTLKKIMKSVFNDKKNKLNDKNLSATVQDTAKELKENLNKVYDSHFYEDNSENMKLKYISDLTFHTEHI